MSKPSMLPVILIMVNVVIGSIGQVIIRIGAKGLGNLHTGSGIASSLMGAFKGIFTPYIFTGLVIYAFSAVIWILVLNQVRLSFAYPMISLSYVLVVVLSAIFLHERVPMITVGGLGLIAIGVSLIGYGYNAVK